MCTFAEDSERGAGGDYGKGGGTEHPVWLFGRWQGPASDRHPIAQLTNHDRRVALRWVKGASSFAIFISPMELKRC